MNIISKVKVFARTYKRWSKSMKQSAFRPAACWRYWYWIETKREDFEIKVDRLKVDFMKD